MAQKKITAVQLDTTNVTAGLDTFTSTLKGLAPASGGGTTNFLRADGTWAAPPGGGGGGGSVTSVAVAGNDGITVSGSPITTSGTITLDLDNITPTTISTGTISTTSYIDQVEITPPASPAANTLRHYVTDEQGLSVFASVDSAGFQLVKNRDIFEIARNVSGATINKGEAVYISGVTGNVINIAKARADSLSTMPCIGIAAESIANNAFGRIFRLGLLKNVDTSAFADGDRLFVSSSTAGAFQSTAPSLQTAFPQQIGVVVRSGVGNGQIAVNVVPELVYDYIQVMTPNHGGTGVNNGTRTLTINTNSGTLSFTNAATTLTIANTASVSGTNTGDQTITLTGDVIGSGTGSFATTLATVNSNIGTFNNVTVNAKGLVTAASNVAYLTGNQTITFSGDASGSGTTAVSLTFATVNSSPQTDQFRKITVNNKGLVTATSAVAGSDINAAYGSQTANQFLAAPNGAPGNPSFRAIVAADIPTLNQNTTGTASNVTGTVAIANGGTGQTSQQAALNALAGAVTANRVLRGNGTNVVLAQVDLTTDVTGILPSANGGTGVNNGGRTLTVNTNSGTLTFTNAATTLTVANTSSISGTNTGDQTITLTGDVTGSGTGSFAATLANDAVSNAKLSNVATATIKGRVTAGTGDPEDLTGTQATTLLDVFTTALKGLAPASGGGTTNFLRADGTWAAPPGGGTVTAVSVATANGFAGTSSGGATPALTLTTTVTGLLKGNGTAISAAVAGTDYLNFSGTSKITVSTTAPSSPAVGDLWVDTN